MLNWYIFKTAQSDSLGYGAWLSPEGIVNKVINDAGHYAMALKIIKEQPDVLIKYFKIKTENISIENIDQEELDHLISRHAYDILLDTGWVRIQNVKQNSRYKTFACEYRKSPTVQQEKILANMIEFQNPKEVYIDKPGKMEEFTLEQALQFFKGKEVYVSPLQRFR
jgi:hypothetical protein